MEVHIFDSTDIHLNLAMENCLFSGLPQDEGRILLWKNSPAVVMGRFQNPWLECDLKSMAASGVKLARRQSGGGTVYHDLGNLNICFMDWNRGYDKERNNKILVQTLKKFGLQAYASGRSDIQINDGGVPKKVSGAAFKQKKDRSFHHCTMLLNADLDRLNGHLLSPLSRQKFKSKAIESVRATVANTGVGEEAFTAALIDACARFRRTRPAVIRWSRERMIARLEELEDFREYRKSLCSWQWVFGETPLFELDLEKGDWKVRARSKKGKFLELRLEHDQLHPSYLDDLAKALGGARLGTKEVKAAVLRQCADVYRPQTMELAGILEEAFGVDWVFWDDF